MDTQSDVIQSTHVEQHSIIIIIVVKDKLLMKNHRVPCKQYFLEPLQHLDPVNQLEALQKVLIKTWSIGEVQNITKVEQTFGKIVKKGCT